MQKTARSSKTTSQDVSEQADLQIGVSSQWMRTPNDAKEAVGPSLRYAGRCTAFLPLPRRPLVATPYYPLRFLSPRVYRSRPKYTLPVFTALTTLMIASLPASSWGVTLIMDDENLVSFPPGMQRNPCAASSGNGISLR